MYVCICNAITERTIDQLVAEGCSSLNEIQALTGCADCCGKCTDHAELLVEQALTRQQARPCIPIMHTTVAHAA